MVIYDAELMFCSYETIFEMISVGEIPRTVSLADQIMNKIYCEIIEIVNLLEFH